MKYFFSLLVMLCTITVFSQQKVNDIKYKFMPSSFSYSKKANGYISSAISSPKFKKSSLISLSGSIVSTNANPSIKLLLIGKKDTVINLKLDEHGESQLNTKYIYIHYLPTQFKSARVLLSKEEYAAMQSISIRIAEIPNITSIESIIQPQANQNVSGDRAASCNCPQPSYTSRAGWGCTQTWSPTIAAPTHLVIHHEAPGSSNPNQSSNWAQRVWGTWDYHVNTRGWSDIGYNWLIDPNGVVYEGRYRSSSADPEGAHWTCNAKSAAVCMLGDYTSVNITSAAQNSLVNLYAWKACQYNIDPLLQTYNTAQSATLNNVCGHRDGPCASTTCPGNTLYSNLSNLRTLINNKMTACSIVGEPSNDNCGSNTATSVTSNGACQNGTVTQATSSGLSIPNCTGNTSSTALDVWYKFVAQASTHTITVDPDGTYSGTSNNNYVDPVVAVYSSCSNFLQCEDDAGGGGGNCDITVSGLNVGSTYYIRVFDYGSAAPTNGGFSICVTHQQTPCTYQFNSSSQTVSANGDNYTLGINVPSSCSWSLQESCSWVSLSNTSGTGNSSVTVNVTANTTGQTRTCTVTMNGATHTITQPAQPCQISVTAFASPATISIGGSSSLSTSGSWSQCQWSPSNSLSNASSCFPTASPSSNTTYTVTVTDGNNCTASSSVTVNVAPCQLSVNASANPSTINAGGFSTLSTNGNWVQCQWSPSNTLNSAGSCTPVASPSATTTYTVTVTDGNNCTASANITVNVAPPPCNSSTASFSSPQSHASSSISASVNVTFNPSSANCTWSVLQNDCSWINNLAQSSTQSSGTITYTIPTNSDPERTCTLKVTAGINTYDLVITQQGGTPPPNCSPPISVSDLSINGCQLSVDPLANVLYQWYVNNTPISNTNSNQFAGCNGANYVVVTSLLHNSCRDTSNIINLNGCGIGCPVVGIEDLFTSSFNIYPNPSSGNFNIQFSTEKVEPVTMSLYTAIGQVVKEEILTSASNTHLHTISVSNLAKGIYILQLKAGKQLLNKRIEIQ